MKSKSKKLILIALALILLLSLLMCGCAGEANDVKPETADPAETTVPENDVQAHSPALPENTEKPVEAENADASPEAPAETPDAVEEIPAPSTPAPSPTSVPEPEVSPVAESLKCTISISCETLLSHADELDSGMLELVPESGVLLAATEAEFSEGESVFDVLQRVCRENGIHLEFSSTPAYGSVYIEGIGNIYEFDCGSLSGWMYKVNDWFPNYGCSQYSLTGGEVICWVYTCDLGADVGGSNAS